eukprot:1969364-Amphidinium_carterae.1
MTHLEGSHNQIGCTPHFVRGVHTHTHSRIAVMSIAARKRFSSHRASLLDRVSDYDCSRNAQSSQTIQAASQLALLLGKRMFKPIVRRI